VINEPEKYTKCDSCGAKILEKSAIEVDGRTLCGDCVVKNTNKDVAKVEKIAKKKRDQAYELERQAITLKQKKRGVLLLIIALAAFGVVQIVTHMNKPEPVKSISIDFSKKLPVAKSLITIGIYKYSADKQKLPISLNELYPQYLPTGVDSAFKYFSYKQLDDSSYELELIRQETDETNESDHNEK